jgi:Ca-activated chloride channel family protein
MMLDFIPATSARVDLWRIMQSDLGAADVLYRGILARVTTPAQMRELSAALGLVTVEPSVLDKTLKEAKDPADKVVKLRALSALFPNDLSLALVLLDAIEDAGDTGAARGLSRQLRSRPDADARVRTAVGELFLRLADEDADGAQKEADALEARRAFGEIVEFSPEDPVARRRLGDLLRAHGFFEEASRQYETLAKLTPDDPSVALLLAACADGLGRIEEAVRWTEKGGAAGAPDASQGPFATARAFAATYLAWGKLAARADHDQKTLDALSARLARVLSSAGQQPREGQVRVTLTWAHPELHPVLWSNALGAPMPAPEGDVTLGIAQVMLPDKPGQMVEIRLEPQDLDRARRLGAKAVLTAVFGENKDTEVVVRREIVFAKGDPATKKLHVEGGKVEDAGGDR